VPQTFRNTLITIAVATLAAVATVSVTGCGSDAKQAIVLKGTLSYNADTDGIPIPDEATARISLVELGKDKAHARIVAERSLHKLGASPISFELRVGDQLLEPTAQYGLRAVIVDAKGRDLWQTDKPRRLDPHSVDAAIPLELETQKKARNARDDLHRYRCDDGFHFNTQVKDHGAIVRLGNRRLELDKNTGNNGEQSIYADAHGNRLRIVNNNSALRIDGSTHEQCRRKPGDKGSASTS